MSTGGGGKDYADKGMEYIKTTYLWTSSMDSPSENHTWQQCIAIIINNVINSSAGRHPLQQIKHLPASWQLHLTVHHLLTHASQAYVNDERTGGGLKVLERAGLSAWLLFLCNVSV